MFPSVLGSGGLWQCHHGCICIGPEHLISYFEPLFWHNRKLGRAQKQNSFIVDPTLILRYSNTTNLLIKSIKTITMVTDAADNNAPPWLPPALPRIEGTSQRARGRAPTIPPGQNPLQAHTTHHLRLVSMCIPIQEHNPVGCHCCHRNLTS